MEELNNEELENITGGVGVDLVYRTPKGGSGKRKGKSKGGIGVIENVDMLDSTGYDSDLTLVQPAGRKGPVRTTGTLV